MDAESRRQIVERARRPGKSLSMSDAMRDTLEDWCWDVDRWPTTPPHLPTAPQLSDEERDQARVDDGSEEQ